MTSNTTKTIASANGKPVPEREAAQENTLIEELNTQLLNEINLLKSKEKLQINALGKWQSIFDVLDEPVIVLNKDRAAVKANQAAYELLSTENEDILGQKCYRLFLGRSSPCTDCSLLQPEDPSCRKHEMEVEGRFSGQILRVTCAPVFQETQLVGYIHSALDISHQRNLEKQLVWAQKMEAISTLAGGIAHDFNNILGAILGNADLLLYRLPDSYSQINGDQGQLGIEDIKDHLGAIQKAGLRAKDLVSQILAFSRQTATSRREVIITPVVNEVVKLLQSSLPATIELHAELDEDIGYIFADPSQVHQVLMNLSTNAVDALNNQHGRIEISLHETKIGSRRKKPSFELKNGEYVVLSVRDNGIGMTDEIKERIFDPFFTTREVGEGTGMGLAVLHGIVVDHNGVIDVHSEPGKGSIFRIYFPKIVVRENSSEKNSLINLPTGSETIIFADDEEDIVKMHTEMLEYLGYTVIPAANGEQVLSYLENHLQEIDLVITDQTMPKMTGLELAKKIQSLRSDLPVILCSGYSETVFDKATRQAGINKFLAKPLKMKDLAVTIHQVFFETK
jgi:signal transduction histidine kinase/CheY-like chemotaxis protein